MRDLIGVVLSLLGVAILLAVPLWSEPFAAWLNTSGAYNLTPLAASRALAALSAGLALAAAVRLVLAYPRRRRFWLPLLSAPFVVLYFVAQLVAVETDVTPRNGYVWLNFSQAGMFGSLAFTLALVRNIWKERDD